MVKRVAVIGAGAAGLAALQHMKSRLDEFEPVAYEQSSVIGGTWVYTDDFVDNLGREIQSSMYKHLRTNLPKEVMAFPDFPFPEHLPSFIGHKDVRQYLEDYAKHFELFQFICVGEVERVHPQYDRNDQLSWLVRVRDLTKSEDNVTESVFDAVMICNGHYTVPFVPKILGLQEYTGGIFHSHAYRTPDKCKGKTVLVLGAKSSGIDLAVEIASIADKVWLCHRGPPVARPFPENVTQAPGITRLTHDSAILDDGQVVKVLFVLAVLRAKVQLPSEEEMEEDRKRDYEWRISEGFPPTAAHKMSSWQWDYNDQLAKLAGVEPLPPVVKKLYEHCHVQLTTNLKYRENNYRLCNREEFLQLQ